MSNHIIEWRYCTAKVIARGEYSLPIMRIYEKSFTEYILLMFEARIRNSGASMIKLKANINSTVGKFKRAANEHSNKSARNS